MHFTAEWKSLWPISSAFSPPLLLSNNKNSISEFGPLNFTPNQNITPLLNSPTLAPCLPPPYSNLSRSRFLQKYTASTSSLVGPHLSSYSSHFPSFNALQSLRVPDKDLIIVFFPAGENSDQVGFSLLRAKDGTLSVSQRENFFQIAKEGCRGRQRITRLLVNPFDDDDDVSDGNQRRFKKVVLGILMVSTYYSVYWCKVGVCSLYRENEYAVCLDYMGCADGRVLKGNSVVSACWSPHLKEECLVLLGNGNVLLFDVNCSGEDKGKLAYLANGKNRVVRKRMHVSLNDKVRLEKEGDGGEGGWFHCEFSWHPRILIAAHHNTNLIQLLI